jgi:hypothetical protein
MLPRRCLIGGEPWHEANTARGQSSMAFKRWIGLDPTYCSKCFKSLWAVGLLGYNACRRMVISYGVEQLDHVGSRTNLYIWRSRRQFSLWHFAIQGSSRVARAKLSWEPRSTCNALTDNAKHVPISKLLPQRRNTIEKDTSRKGAIVGASLLRSAP